MGEFFLIIYSPSLVEGFYAVASFFNCIEEFTVLSNSGLLGLLTSFVMN